MHFLTFFFNLAARMIQVLVIMSPMTCVQVVEPIVEECGQIKEGDPNTMLQVCEKNTSPNEDGK
jgi:hypothetical protein